MRIVIINTTPTLPGNGVPLIYSLLKRAGHSVQTVSLARQRPIQYEDREIEQLGDLLKHADMAMIGVYSAYLYRAVQVTEFIRRKFPRMKVIWGGPHCVAAPENSLRHADGVCFSEGDECVVGFVEKFEAGDEDYVKTPNMAFKVNGSLVINPALPPYKDLDALPLQDCSLKEKFILDRELSPATKDVLKRYFMKYPFGRPIFWLLTTRGCPYKCSYCNNSRYISLFGHNKIRRQSVNRFMDELENSLKVFDLSEIVGLGDDDFLLRPVKELKEFGERYKRNVGLPFTIFASATSFTKEKIEILLDCGLKGVQIGVQSGSTHILNDIFTRDVSLSKTKTVISQMVPYKKTHNLCVFVDFIIDNPYETKADIVETCRYVLGMPKGAYINLFKLIFFPGTPLYERAVRDGFIEPFDESEFEVYYGKIKDQINYPTFLLLLMGVINRRQLDRFVPQVILSALSSRLFLILFGLFPKFAFRPLIELLNRLMPRHVDLEITTQSPKVIRRPKTDEPLLAGQRVSN